MSWSSEPEASSRPDVDQLMPLVSSDAFLSHFDAPQSIHTSCVCLQLIDNIKISEK